jgi:hypothetical protein
MAYLDLGLNDDLWASKMIGDSKSSARLRQVCRRWLTRLARFGRSSFETFSSASTWTL